jgi:nucleoside-diphosphate-sugar epimerase
MLALVTGATGLIGRKLVDDLLAQGIEVRALLRTDGARIAPKGVRVAVGDLRDPNAVMRAAQDCTWIYHLGAVVHGADATAENFRSVNIEGTANVARAALAARARRVIYTSSAAVYGRSVSRHGIDEETPIRPDSPYGESKVSSEKVLFSYADLPVVIVRTVTVWGPGASLWAGLFETVAANRFQMAGSGRGMHTLTHVADLATGLMLCGTIPGIDRKIYLLTGEEAVSLNSLMAMIAEETGAAPIRSGIPEFPLRLYRVLDQAAYRCLGTRVPKADRLDLFLGDRTFEVAKAQRDLGFAPKFSAREIVQSTADYLRSEGLLRHRS